MVWAELWYNTIYHKSIQTTPFKVVYGRDPPPILRFEQGFTDNFELEKALLERDQALQSLKCNLSRSQKLMKNQADKSCRDVQLAVEDMVFLKLQSYRQKTVAHRVFQKLAAKFYGPYRVLERIGNTFYKLQLPEEAQIHPFFHISQLKLALGPHEQSSALPPRSITEADEPIEPEDVLEKGYDKKGELELLVKWKGKFSLENSWLLYLDFIMSFPDYQFKGKLDFFGGSIDRFKKAYYRKNKGRREKDVVEEEEKDSNE